MYINEIMLIKHFEGEKCYAGISTVIIFYVKSQGFKNLTKADPYLRPGHYKNILETF